MSRELDWLDEKLEQARKGAERYGQKRGLKDTADDYLKIVHAQLYEDVPSCLKTNPEKDAWVKRQPEYLEAVEEKKNRYAGWTAAEVYVKLLFAEADKYRSDKAMDRDMMKQHR